MGWALKVEGLITPPLGLSPTSSALGGPWCGLGCGSSSKPAQLAQSGGAARPLEHSRCHHGCPAAP